MKKFTLFMFIVLNLLQAQAYEKSAVVYYGEDISYPTLGIHDYIILQPKHVRTNTPGFAMYKEKIYAYVSIGEIDKHLQCYDKVQKEWIAAKNKMWQSDVLDIKNKAYREFVFKHQIEPLRQKGFQNFFFDTLDSYEFYTTNDAQRKANQEALASFILEFHKRYPDAKLIVNRGFDIMDKIHNAVTAVLFESYFNGLQNDAKHPYKELSKDDRSWLDAKLKKVRTYHKDIICVDYLPANELFGDVGKKLVKKLHAKGFIPYVSTKDLDLYGISSKTPIKREIFVLIDEHRLDRTLLDAHQYGSTVLEYLGYKEVLYNINKHPFPPVETLHRYSGVVIWLQDYIPSIRLKHYLTWLKKLKEEKIKLLFISNFGANFTKNELSFLGISFSKTYAQKVKILKRDPNFMDFEIDPPMSSKNLLIHAKDANELLSYLYSDNQTSTPAALTPWGGYFVDEGYMVNIENNNIWVANPFLLFEKTLHLQKTPVADVTTQSGKRLLFTHIDGDGIANRVEGDFGKYAIDSIYNHILKVYDIPHSVSFIGSELDPKGRYPNIVDELRSVAKKILALPNVEGATHTYTHPFFWGKIKNDDLAPSYRIDIKGYKFSLKKELYDTLIAVNKLAPPGKYPKAKTVFWSGDCAPRINALNFVYEHKLLNINGGDTIISNEHPWLSNIAPLGLERSNFTQIYTGEQNENVFTNDWLGPFWGFKRVIQTYKKTNSPRRFKPIDIYYHFYSGSKQASLKALKEVFNWALKQDVRPIFTSQYIPRVMEFYNYSLAKNSDGSYLFCGLRDLDTIRIEQSDTTKTLLPSSDDVIGMKQFQSHLYYTLFTKKKQKNSCIIFGLSNNTSSAPYLVESNGLVENYDKNATTYSYTLHSHVPLKADFFVPQTCQTTILPKPKQLLHEQENLHISYKQLKTAKVTIQCSKN